MLVLQGPVAWAARLFIVMPVVWWLLHSQFGISLRALLRAVSAPFAAALLMGLAVQAGRPWLDRLALAPLGELLLGSAAGLVSYVLFVALLLGAHHARAAWRPAANREVGAS
jgi:hypothetical protein